MKTKLMIAMLALMAALSATPAWAQLARVKGKVTDFDGKPMAGAVVEFKGVENGRTYPLKVDSKGEFFSIGVSQGMYNVRLLKDGTEVTKYTNFQVTTAREENVCDFDLAKDRARAVESLKPEDKKRMEEEAARAEKIKGVNNMLSASDKAYKAENYAESVRILTEASKLDLGKNAYIVLAKLGEANMAAGRQASKTDKEQGKQFYQQAADAYKKAIEQKPTEAAFYNNLAEAYLRSGQMQDAIKQYQAAIENDPTDPKYYFNLGAVLTNAGQIDEANAAFDKAIAADPNYAEAYYQKSINLIGRAKVDPKTGTMQAPPEVAAGFNKYLELSPDGPNAEAAKQMITALGAKVETSFGKGRAPAKKK
jgi:tetratricopeptide (TPR) repeat protein